MSTPTTWNEAVSQIFAELRDLITRKQQDYGPGNIAAFGEFGVLVRMNDKLERLKHLCLSRDAAGRVQWHPAAPANANESIDDSLQDLANYAVIALMLRRGWWELPFESRSTDSPG